MGAGAERPAASVRAVGAPGDPGVTLAVKSTTQKGVLVSDHAGLVINEFWPPLSRC